MAMMVLMEDVDESKIIEEQDYFDEETLCSSQLQGFLKHKKVKDKCTQEYEYQNRYGDY